MQPWEIVIHATEGTPGDRPIREGAVVKGGLGGMDQGIAVALSRRSSDVAALDRTTGPAQVDALAANVASDLRLVAVKYVARAVARLASGDLPFITGGAIPVDGGMHIHHY